jgi:dihydroorotate dehydrogenase
MGFYYEQVIRPLLFRLDPEKAHDVGVTALDYLGRCRWLCRLMANFNNCGAPRPVELFGLQFPNAVGLAAGMDKNGRFWRAAAALGFGHAEIGTVTHLKQPGNERPRIFRYPEQQAVINRMGFNNDGAAAMAARLKASGRKPGRDIIPLGINIGKSKVVPLEQAVDDYLKSFNLLVEYADYISLNVSSPNTPGLRRLQEREPLDALLGEVTRANRNRARKLGEKPRPILLKIAPDLSFRGFDTILEIVQQYALDGIIATNTTLARPGPFSSITEGGGLSGPPLHGRMVQVVKYLSQATHGRLPIIAVGGIDSPESAGAALDAGAHLVQIYTGMVYRGPFVAKTIARALAPRQHDWV